MTPQLGRLLAAAVTLATARPRRTLWIASVLVAASALTASWGMTVKTSNLDLVDPDLPEVRRFREFAHEFGTPNFLAVVFEGDSGAHFGEAVDRVAPRLLAVPGVRSVMSRSPQDEALLALTGDEPYLRSDDGQLYFIFVRPEDAESRADTIAPLVEGVRAVLARSDLEELGVRAGLTGLPAYAIDDRDVIRNDISRLSLWSFVLILALFGTAFGTVRRPLLAMAALVAAVTVVLGLAAIYPGHLTLLSAFFASILFGLGVDYGIHVVDRIEEHVAEGSSERAAVVDAVTALGPSLATSALTTASVFFAMQFAGFRGFAELGLIAGTGVLVCLLAMVTVLPALLVVAPPRRLRERALSDRRLGKALIALQHRPVAWLLGAAALASALLGAPAFDSDYLNLQPADSEAVRLERAMVARSRYSPQFAAFVVDSLDEVGTLSERLLDQDVVGEVHSVADFGMLSPLGAQVPIPEAIRSHFESPKKRYAIYAYPAGDIWDPDVQDEFLKSMSATDPEVTGMPFLGRFMIERSKRALRITAAIGGVLLLLWVWLDFGAFRPTIAALLPTVLTVTAMGSLMRLFSVDLNPLSIMALPVILGVAVDDGVHVVHRFLAENGDLERTLGGTGRSIVLTSCTTLAAFGALALGVHRGLASFAMTLTLGVGSALILSVLVLPVLLPTLLGMPAASRPARATVSPRVRSL